MSPAELALVLGAGVVAGGINTVVGSGSLVTFPLLVALGLSPVAANISSKLGILPGGVSGTWGYRRELRDLRHLFGPLLATSAVGGLAGALLLLVLPSETFDAVVPVLIALAGVLVVAQPAIKRWVARRAQRTAAAGEQPPSSPEVTATPGATDVAPVALSLGLLAGVAAVGVYSGYFGAAQGVMYMAVLGVATHASMQQQNALKNLTALASNGMSALVFVVVAREHVDWLVVALLAGGSLVGGLLGARVARSLSPAVLRGIVALICLAAVISFVR
ncbi:sulfite exporter TauE/SafE family protein [Kytococcus sedentarius]|uniref:Probable membrane transporter protein n=1 Tax=Kytococcus sedentarius (strain ATCC 14392 / DSM 20547 / JCM 11482 / CCUG 33030 / NBRC 15357 / NCTC 11040 / CCM 314 / 541) TaxID=478801 RepID=C7NHM9_KYTSD|nr:sulfite exporter TauE/SafE family protein [Kytococcus sedentarius]ACV06386.1 predicted permease [Kytococcus sedentarius DSM 20547]QQB64712.1 sulfite exporter TauE/SafE family protein [Kytococcus sedentarius]STX12193.1 Sulfite exporter TauE/SafE [Kytococcus sedentarius]